MEVDAGRTAARSLGDGRPAPGRELRDSFLLLGLVISSLGAYIGLGALAVRLLAGS
ncbi:MAG TPA: hypothetical protein VGA42_07625 [Gemmatimonadales bacterium]